MNFLKRPPRILLTAAAVATLAAMIVPQAAHSDPFDGYFSGDAPTGVATSDAKKLFERINSHETERRLVEVVNIRVAAMRLTNDAWWAASEETRDDFLAVLAETLKTHFSAMHILTVQIKDIVPSEADRVFVATGDMILEEGPALQVTWVLREDQGDLRIIEADTPDGTLLLPESVRDLLSQDDMDLAVVTETLRVALP